MLEVSTLRGPSKADQRGGFVGDHVGFPTSAADCDDDFMVDDNLLDYIDFSCCDVPFFDADGDDILPDLEVDPTELLAEFSSPEANPPPDGRCQAVLGDDGATEAKPQVVKQEGQQQEQVVMIVEAAKAAAAAADENNMRRVLEKDEKAAAAGVTTKNGGDAEGSSAVTTTEEEDSAGAGSDTKSSSSASAGGQGQSHSKKKTSAAAASKNSNGKRKVKVDWTPELHRRFVQAVEQLGIDKAVPSRILEIMGIECLTRHNIASHLQKYRSHRKHLMAREAEAATWAQKRQMYAAAAAAGATGGAAPARKDAVAAAAAGPWVVPTIGFPPPAMAHHHQPPPFCRPLHVWGHPPTVAVEAAAAAPPPTMLPVWPRHLAPPRPWAAVDPAAYWHQHQHQQYNAARKWAPQPPAAAAVTQGTPCVVPPTMPPSAMVQLPTTRFPVPGMVPMYRPTMVVPPPSAPPPPTSKLAELQLQLDAHPSKESIDAAIGDVLVKPWLPLPLGLKPPSLDSVMSELHRQGIPKVPPAAT